MRLWAVVALGGLVVATASCTGGGKTHTTAPVILDGGALEIRPVQGGHPAISREQAAAAAIEIQTFVTGEITPIFGLATTRVPGSASKPAASLVANLAGTLAWVYVAHPGQYGGGASCPAGVSGPQTPWPTPSSGSLAVIVNAQSGQGYVYRSPGVGVCGGSPAPSLTRAYRQLSVPWTLVGTETIRINLPPCAYLGGFQFGPRRWEATATAPIGPCKGKATVRVLPLAGRANRHPPAPTGPICWQLRDPAVPKPDDCVDRSTY
ncbi:MAG: hypothetical protein QOG53_1509 [Frankiales bacterium]|jgi:hypothetical protein|nr:hypothetical protein [Frankiales bacterium]